MAYDIGPRIGIQGEKEFNNQIRAINNQIRECGSEMNALTSKFADNAKGQDALIAKTKVLEKEYDAQKQKSAILQSQYEKEVKKLRELAAAVEKAKKENGEGSAEATKAENAFNKQAEAVSKLKVAMNETEGYMSKLEREISGNTTALSEMEAGTRDASTGLSKIADEADEAGKSLKKAGEDIEDIGKKLDADMLMDVADSFSSIADNAISAAEESKEFMRIYGQLKASSENLGYTNKETNETFRQLYGILGDDQTAATTTANLQALGLEQGQLRKMTEGVIGAWAQYGDSIPIDGLAESVNETVKVGSVTGTLADALNWAGTSEDEFNEKLAACRDESDRANLIMQEFAKQGLMDSAKGYRENNKELIENNEAQMEYKKTMAELGETILPIMTMLTESVTKAVQAFNSLPEPMQTVILGATGLFAVISKIAPVFAAVNALMVANGAAGATAAAGTAAAGTAAGGAAAGVGALSTSLLPIAGIILGVVAAIAAVVLAIKNWDKIVDWFKENIGPKIEAVKEFFTGLGDKIGEIKDNAKKKLKEMKDDAVQKFEDLKSKGAEKIEDLKSKAASRFEDIRSSASNKLANAKEKAVSAFEGIRQSASEKLTNAKEKAVNRFEDIRNAAQSKLTAAKERAASAFGGIADSAKDKLETAKTTVSNAIGWIRDTIDRFRPKFPSFEIPHIPLPHFSIEGQFSLNPPSIPHFGISWYKEGGILSGAQIFGRLGGNLLGGGESGKEAVLPLTSFYDELRNIFHEALEGNDINYNSSGAIELHAVTNVYIGNKEFKSYIAETAINGISKHVKDMEKVMG